jgi:hypothetical protein
MGSERDLLFGGLRFSKKEDQSLIKDYGVLVVWQPFGASAAQSITQQQNRKLFSLASIFDENIPVSSHSNPNFNHHPSGISESLFQVSLMTHVFPVGPHDRLCKKVGKRSRDRDD